MKVRHLFENDFENEFTMDRDKRIEGLDHELDLLVTTFKTLLRKHILMSEPNDRPGSWGRFIVPKTISNSDFVYHMEPGEKGHAKARYMAKLQTKLEDVWNQYKMLKHGVSYDDEDIHEST